MLLRICLILTIVAGLATAYLGFFPVKEIITTTREARDDFHTKLTAETDLQNKTASTLKKTKAQLETTTAKLTETQGELDAANSKNDELTKQTADLTDKLTKTTARADKADDLLEQYRQLPPPKEILAMIGDLKVTKTALTAIRSENKLLITSRDDYKRRWEAIFGGESSAPVLMPDGLKGVVMAVDPKYDFVVLNIGDEQGVKERGELMVERKGRLIGKIRISSVEKDRSVASIMPEWKKGQIMEGDQVIY